MNYARKILVTGGAGFIGSNMAERLANDPDSFVVIVDDLSTGHTLKLPDTSKYPNVRFIKCDVNDFSDISAVFFAHRFDYVFHYAALVGVQRTLQNPVSVLKDLRGFEHLLYLSKNTGVKRVYFSSSSEVYGEPVEFPQNESTTPLNSRLPYAIVKNVGEAFLKSFQQEYGLEYTIFRFFNTYGPKQSKDFVMSRFIKLARENKPLTLYGGGTQTRTFCFIKDNVDACYEAFRNDTFVNDVVNVGGAEEITIRHLAETICKLTESNSELLNLPPLPEGDMTRRLPDVSKMNELLNRPRVSLEDGIKAILNDPRFESYP
jgi:nucleoside-diphosphate-sugar epimerase